MAKYVYAFADSLDSRLASLKDEFEGIAELIKEKNLKGECELIPYASYEKIRKSITADTMYFHFAGHGYTDSLGLLDDELRTEEIASKLIEDIFSKGREKLKLIFLNGCKTSEFKAKLAPYTERLIVTKTSIGDHFAARFSIDFYENFFLRNNNIIDSFNKSSRYISSKAPKGNYFGRPFDYSRASWNEIEKSMNDNLQSDKFFLFFADPANKFLHLDIPTRSKLNLANIQVNNYYNLFMNNVNSIVNECKDSMSEKVYQDINSNGDDPQMVFKSFKSDLPFPVSYPFQTFYQFLLTSNLDNSVKTKESIILHFYQIYFSFLYNLIFYLTGSIWSHLQNEKDGGIHSNLKIHLQKIFRISEAGELDFNLFENQYITKIKNLIEYLKFHNTKHFIQEIDLLYDLDFEYLLEIEDEIHSYIDLKHEANDEKLGYYIFQKDINYQFSALERFSSIIKWMMKFQMICVSDIKLIKNRTIKHEKFFFSPTPLVFDNTTEKPALSNNKYPDSNAILIIKKNVTKIDDKHRDFTHALNLTPFIFDKNKDSPNDRLIDLVFLYKADSKNLEYFSVKNDQFDGILDKYISTTQKTYIEPDVSIPINKSLEMKAFIEALIESGNNLEYFQV